MLRPTRLSPLALLLAGVLSSGCQGPFDVVRDQLGPFRIAAIGVVDGKAAAAVWSGEGRYHSTSPVLSWSVDGEQLGEGWDVEVPDSGTLALTAAAADGTSEHAEVTIAQRDLTLWVEREQADLGEDLTLEARRAVVGESVRDTVSDGTAARLRLTAPEAAGALPDDGSRTVRWMTADGAGSLLELDTWSADVLAEEVVFDDGVVEERTPVDPGVFLQLALVIDGTGRNAWTWVDAAVGVTAPLLRHRNRLVELPDGSTVPAEGLVAVTLSADGSQDGVQLVDPVGGADLADGDDLPCAATDVAFELSWIVEGRCGLDEISGARVVLETW